MLDKEFWDMYVKENSDEKYIEEEYILSDLGIMDRLSKDDLSIFDQM